ncbi:OpgC family protein [Sagittula salina]|uniref:OpgC domain-containing protein n=1 Tax=Sagittula salina TaxID=2820268 RepID=A0A940MRY2_9RHOB|nr:OpgC domain-containing protein [Sagittula salina]MBP0483907.1 OpgC domain-containing protein [Sagittula salina]
MTQPQIIPLSARTPVPVKAPRDPRIDMFRGLALVMILINHMPGNPWEAITSRNFGFSDAAEAFFVMSGIAAGIAYSPAMLRWLDGKGRLRDAVLPLWRRAWTLYMVQMLLTVLALGLFAWATYAFVNPKFSEMHNLATFYRDPAKALIGLPLLGFQIGYVNILPSYIVLMLAAPLALIGGLRFPRLTLAASVTLWLIGGIYRLNIPNYPGNGGWFLSPLSWQLIFVVGLLIGIRHRRGERLVPVSRLLLAVAAGYLLFVLAWREIPALGQFINHKMAQLSSVGVPYPFTSHNKTYLAFPRLSHMLAVVYVLSCLGSVRVIAGHRLAAPLRLLGRHSLPVFAFGTMLALSGQIVFVLTPDQEIRWLIPPLAALLSWGLARLKVASAPSPAPAQTGATQPARPSGLRSSA